MENRLNGSLIWDDSNVYVFKLYTIKITKITMHHKHNLR